MRELVIPQTFSQGLNMSFLSDQRVLFSDNATLLDISVNVGDFREGSSTINYTVSEDYIYIGSFLPFNHKHFDIGTVNDQSASLTVEIWDGSAWVAAVDIIDQTSTSGVPLSKDGIISWSSDVDDSPWNREQKSEDITGLTGTKIYNMYWVRLSYSASLNASTSLEYIGHKFSKDAQLYDVYPEFNDSNVLTSFETGKTDWEEQHYLAADYIIRDLKQDNAIVTADQLLDWQIFREASIHACAMIIYWGLSQFEKHDKAKSKYEVFRKNGFLNIDLNRDSRLNVEERGIRQGFLGR